MRYHYDDYYIYLYANMFTSIVENRIRQGCSPANYFLSDLYSSGLFAVLRVRLVLAVRSQQYACHCILHSRGEEDPAKTPVCDIAAAPRSSSPTSAPHDHLSLTWTASSPSYEIGLSLSGAVLLCQVTSPSSHKLSSCRFGERSTPRPQAVRPDPERLTICSIR